MTRQIYDASDIGIVGKKFAESLYIGAVTFNEIRTNACDSFYAVKHFTVGVGEIVDDDHRITGLLEFDYGMRTYISGSACY